MLAFVRDATGVDTVRFGAGITPANVAFRVADNGADLLIGGLGNSAMATVLGQFQAENAVNQMERFEFADGTVWSAAQVRAAAMAGGAAADTIQGSVSSDTISGAGGHDTLLGGDGADTIHGDAGNDTMAGEAGADALYGDADNDTLSGGDGNDQLSGGAGLDRLDGGNGDDVYLFGPGSGMDIVTQDSAGADIVRLAAGITAANVTLYRVSSPPAADLAFNGDSLVIQLNGSPDQLWIANYFATGSTGYVEQIVFADGTSWNYTAITSRLSTAGGTANAISGTSRVDTFTIDHWNDTLPTPTSGDLAQSSVSYRLPGTALAGFTFTGTLNLFGVAGGGAYTTTGNAGDNVFQSALNASGAVYAGGRGDDQYLATGPVGTVTPGLDPATLGITITELAGEGSDTYFSGFWSARLAANVENLVLLSPNPTRSGSYYVNLSRPNDYAHYFNGNGLNNTIDSTLYEAGMASQWWKASGGILTSARTVRLDGGAGADTLIGGVRDNVYVIDQAGDTIIETGFSWSGADLSNDTIVTPFTTSLAALPHIENITLIGTAAVSATGDAGANRLDGSSNSATNVLVGGAGDDTYVVGVGDVVQEAANAGFDTVVVAASASSTVLIGDYANIEQLRLAAGAGALDMQGGAADDGLIGSWGNNRINGGGGNDYVAGQYLEDAASYYNEAPNLDADVLEGGSGDDTLISYRGSDTLDGGTGNDTLRLEYLSASTDVVTVRFGTGAGQDTLLSSSLGSARRVAVQLLPGVGLADVQLAEVGGDSVRLTLPDGSSLLMQGTTFRASAGYLNLVSMSFDDGATVTGAAFDALVRTRDRSTPTEQADVLAGTAAADVISARGGDDLVVGADGADVLAGGSGNDSLYGGAGADTLAGDAGDDLLVGGSGADVYRFSRGFGRDVIDDLPANATDDGATDVVQFDATVAPADVAVYRMVNGTTPVGLVLALAGNTETIDLNRTLVSGAPGAVELVRFADGTQWDLAALTARVSGQAGGAGADTLTGTAAADVLDGRGGADTMSGLAGDDTYYVDSAADVVTEAATAGNDTVVSTITYTLGANLERLQLAGSAAINGTGNALNNALTGNAAANRLDGGAGSDTMAGGAGDDTYVVDATGDVVTELDGQGTDTIESSVTRSLVGTAVENLLLTGTGKINGTGNELDNVLTGNAAVNTLRGGAGNDTLDGGLGNDTMVGGAGNDTYVVNVATDVVTELANEGVDTVLSAVTLTLANNVENLTLTGSGAINATGNTLANILVGSSGANVLTGGAGDDSYDGAGGADTYSDTSTTSNDTYRWGTGSGLDTLTDSGGTLDHVDLFAGIASNQLQFAHVGNNLELTILGNALDKLTMNGWYTSAVNRIEEFRLADGSVILGSQFNTLGAGQTSPGQTQALANSLIDAMAAFSQAGASAFDTGGRMHIQPIRPGVELTASALL